MFFFCQMHLLRGCLGLFGADLRYVIAVFNELQLISTAAILTFRFCHFFRQPYCNIHRQVRCVPEKRAHNQKSATPVLLGISGPNFLICSSDPFLTSTLCFINITSSLHVLSTEHPTFKINSVELMHECLLRPMTKTLHLIESIALEWSNSMHSFHSNPIHPSLPVDPTLCILVVTELLILCNKIYVFLPQKQMNVSHGEHGALIKNVNSVLLYYIQIFLQKNVNAFCYKPV